MPCFFANRCALPGEGETTATTSASSGMILKDSAWMSASNCEPMMPTLTRPLLLMLCSGEFSLGKCSACGLVVHHSHILMEPQERGGKFCGNGALAQPRQNAALQFPTDQQQNPPRSQDL